MAGPDELRTHTVAEPERWQEPAYPPLDERWSLTFLTAADGRVRKVEIPLEPSIKPIRFEAVATETEG